MAQPAKIGSLVESIESMVEPYVEGRNLLEGISMASPVQIHTLILQAASLAINGRAFNLGALERKEQALYPNEGRFTPRDDTLKEGVADDPNKLPCEKEAFTSIAKPDSASPDDALKVFSGISPHLLRQLKYVRTVDLYSDGLGLVPSGERSYYTHGRNYFGPNASLQLEREWFKPLVTSPNEVDMAVSIEAKSQTHDNGIDETLVTSASSIDYWIRILDRRTEEETTDQVSIKLNGASPKLTPERAKVFGMVLSGAFLAVEAAKQEQALKVLAAA